MKTSKILSVIVILLLLTTSVVAAHPGRTDSRGGHTCRTNCERWGLEYGEYHYHNGGSSRSSSSSKSSKSSIGAGKSSSSSSNSSQKPKEPAYTVSELRVYVNDQELDFVNRPIIQSDTNLVPLREIAEALGATVVWEEKTSSIHVTRDKHSIKLKMGSKSVTYNEKKETLQVAPLTVEGVTYVPVQVLARGLGAKISYSSKDDTLKLTIGSATAVSKR